MNTMQSIQRCALLLAALIMSLMTAGTARAQTLPSGFDGKFTLTTTVHWGKTALPPGTYTLTVDSVTRPGSMAIIRNDRSTIAIRVMSRASSDCHTGSNFLRLKVRDGSLVVQSLVLADLGRVLIYDASPAQQSLEEARANASIPILVARK